VGQEEAVAVVAAAAVVEGVELEEEPSNRQRSVEGEQLEWVHFPILHIKLRF